MKWGPALAAAGVIAVVGVLVFLLSRAPDDAPSPEATVLDVTVGRYHYTPGSQTPLNVSMGAEVVLRIHSEDVTHGLAITEYGVSVEVPAGQTVEVRFRADRAGDFTIYCTVFCGSGHPQHKGTLHVA